MEAKDTVAATNRLEDQVQRARRSLQRMQYREDIYSALSRFERVMVSESVPKFRWVDVLDQLLIGKHLTNYRSHVGVCVGDYDSMRTHLINSGGFSLNDCWDTVLNSFRPNGSLRSVEWSQQASHKNFTLFKNMGESEGVDDTILEKLAHGLAVHFVVLTMSREGRAFFMSAKSNTAPARLRAYEDFIKQPNYDFRHHSNRSYRNEHYSKERAHSSHSGSRYNNDNRKESNSSGTQSGKTEKQEFCYQCGDKDHKVPQCPQPPPPRRSDRSNSKPYQSSINNSSARSPFVLKHITSCSCNAQHFHTTEHTYARLTFMVRLVDNEF